jgi:hypothetical protein
MIVKVVGNRKSKISRSKIDDHTKSQAHQANDMVIRLRYDRI